MKILDKFKQIDWQFYIKREVNFATEQFMHEGWIKFTKKTFKKPLLKRINYYTNGFAKIYISQAEKSLFKNYFKNLFVKNKLNQLYIKCINDCKKVESWLPKLSRIKYQTTSNFELVDLYSEMREKSKSLALSLIAPRLVSLALTELENPENKVQINTLQDKFSKLNEYRRILTSEKLYKLWLPLFEGIGKRNNLNLNEVLFLLPQEIIDLLNNRLDRQTTKKLCEKRLKSCIYIFIDGKVDVLVKKIKKYASDLPKDRISKSKKVLGNCASVGKVKAKARLIFKANDYQKIKSGDIAVTFMTQPEISKVIDKVSGIITDEGGILCHAAIIARENNIPCLTATQIATSILKDNDEVLLNATEGYFIKNQSNLL
ncbi:hypothetical protein A2954_03770 [Candidatus Roizmanbacteria bacterium RIFCSPLOWO2_01_FULL_37_12]|uniref:PEP-utilising enzyme mobile domain-containing protein n=1 Tax=Candidatus Roizmanbacteria bacterium RIFCSPLOWO2_01_FULL_37_12 TaxID=1802056 RepID=A0A1F7IEL3_9BACT|nr:MAG: hypothetical protein A2954_03770 [Candidatus Roizmanbacteria bacterium RIFCSPLOWO2_01_FULL_37_12]